LAERVGAGVNNQPKLFGFVAAILSIMSVLLMAVPAPVPTYSIQGMALAYERAVVHPLGDVKFEVRTTDAAAPSIQSAEDGIWGAFTVPVGEIRSDENGEFKLERLSIKKSYRIKPVSSEFAFSPSAVTLRGEELARLVHSRAVLSGFLFEAKQEVR
jgi:hypothetical protein